jgi:hypothetical protein
LFGAPHEPASALFANTKIRSLTREKHSGLICPTVTDEDKMFYNLVTML